MGGWRDMSAEALEEQYSPSRWSPRLGSDAIVQAHLEATAAGTQQARAEARTSLHVPYGDGDREKLDIYFPADPAGTFPLLVYIHGGYWQCLRVHPLDTPALQPTSFCFPPSKDESGFAALPLVSRGVAVAAVGYDTAPTGAVLVSGVYDLEPILHTYVNDELNMSQEVAQRNSPMLHITPAAMACQVLVAVAQHDSPEFRRQSQEYGQVSCGQRPAWPCSEAAPALPAWDEELTSCIRAMFLLHVGGCQWQQFTGGCQSLRTVPAVWSGADGSQGPSCQHCSLHRPCVQLAGLFPCWILLVWTTLTSLRSCQRRATSSLR
ncbi:kynurenine formamidase isoform X8 [Colius striatus]|uniref:kynurenine formamidase isoform X8 n=1 Tax=Colius striatus TaxID=57412 RepID=UPI002B1D1D58|nr:kynurenine formamidase isoform X8 [Colius striatus]